MALIGLFGSLLGGIGGNALYKGGQKLAGTAAGKMASSAGNAIKASAPVQSIKSGVGRLGEAMTTRNVEKFGPIMGDNVASKIPKVSSFVANPVKRYSASTLEGLTGAELKAQQKLVNKSTNNLYLGLRLNKPAQGVVVAGAVAGIAGKQVYDEVRRDAYGDPMSGNVQSVGDMPRMNSDMIGGVQNGRRDLGASGDIVLALNKKRNGR